MDLAKSVSMESLAVTPPRNPDPEPPDPPPPAAGKSLLWKAQVVFGNISVEPIMVCYVLPNVMASLAMQNLTLEKACRVDLQLDAAVCDAMAARNESGYGKADEEQVQKLVATAMACKNIIQSLLPSVLLMFLGSWSDRHGRRKPCILLPIVGEMVTATGFILCTYFFHELSIVYNVIAEAVPPAVTGGWFAMFMGVFAYISAVSGVETRTLRIGAVNMFSNVSVTIGIALSGVLYKEIGFYGVFGLALAAYTVGLLWGAFGVRDVADYALVMDADRRCSRHVQVGAGPCAWLADFFDVSHIRETFAVAFKEGERNRKKRICTVMVLVMVIIGPMHGEMNVMYLFVRYKFGWNEIDYSLYSTFNLVAHMSGTIFALMCLSRRLQVDDALLGMISSMSKILSCFVYAFAPNSQTFYLGALVEMLNGTSFIAMRSIISKLVPADELGKIYSLFGVSEALMPLLYGPMYSFIYKHTIAYLPGAFFLAGGILTVPSVLIFLWLYREHKRDQREAKHAAFSSQHDENSKLHPKAAAIKPGSVIEMVAMDNHRIKRIDG